MKKMFALLFCIIGLQLHASDPTIFEDRDLGIRMPIPHELAKNWEITHTPTGAKLDIYHSDINLDKYYVLVLGKMPLADLQDMGIVNLSSIMTAQLKATLGEDFIDDVEVDVDFDVCEIHQKLNVDIDSIGYRLQIRDEDMGITLPIHIQIFYANKHALFLLTAVNPEMGEENLEHFTKLLLNSVNRIAH